LYAPTWKLGQTAPVANVALIGYGLAGSAFHAPFVAATDGLELGAIVTSNEERRAQARERYPGAKLLASPDDLWASASDFDAVVIAAPNRVHVPLTLAALDLGLHVVVDKPLATNAAEGRMLVARAAERSLLLTVFQNRRWDGDFLTVRRLVDEGALGTVVRMESRLERWRPRVEARWRESPDPADGGGLLLDLGSHLVDQALLLFGRVATVHAELGRRRRDAEVEDDVFLALEHESGVESHLSMTLVAAQAAPRFRVLGTRAAYVKRGVDLQEEALRAGRRPDEPDWGLEPEERWGLLGADGDARRVPTERGSYLSFYEGLAAALRDGASPPVDPMDAVAVLDVLDRARVAAAVR
jgi:scyllo-inositol 2-dehydrogenase (NADP+)